MGMGIYKTWNDAVIWAVNDLLKYVQVLNTALYLLGICNFLDDSFLVDYDRLIFVGNDLIAVLHSQVRSFLFRKL